MSKEETKFELGQTVFAVYDGKIVESKVDVIITEQRTEQYESGCVARQTNTLYECIGDFIFNSGRGSYYSRRQQFKHDKIFETKEEAIEYLNKHFSEYLNHIGDSIYIECRRIKNLRKKDCFSDKNYEFVKMAKQMCKFIQEFKQKK